MRHGTAPNAARILRLFVIGGGTMLLPMACAPLATQSPANTAMSNVGAFEHGEVALNCRVACAAAWNASRPELLRRYIAANWHGLADLVIETDFQNDLAYFYLGRAAEGLGKNDAALNYYRIAGALATGPDQSLKCRDGAGSCDSFSFPDELYDRIRIVRAAMGHGRPAVGHHSLPRTQPGPSSAERSEPEHAAAVPAAAPGAAMPSPPGDAWVDPPPVNH